MNIPFTKASACGNDFLIVEGAHAPGNLAEASQRMCDRHNGVGADGVEWLFPPPGREANAAARLINADGSEAEISGNGTRCAAAYLVDGGWKGDLAIATGAGVKHCRLVARDGNTFVFEMDMGSSQVGGDFSVETSFGRVTGTPVSLGNPHFVIFVNELPSEWQKEGAEIGRNSAFPHGVNVEFVRRTGPNDIEVRFYERGVGETQSSGTGSCAAAAAGIARGHVASPVDVHAPGGTQTVRWTDTSLFLRGPAQLICKGLYLG